MPFEHTITRLVARKVRGTFWTLGAVLALGSLAHAETIEFRHEGGAGLSNFPGPHAITRILKEGGASSQLFYDPNGLLTDVTGDMPLCHEFNVLGKLKRASSESRKSDGCSGATSISYLYTATGEKLAVIEPNKTNVFMGEVRFTNNVPRLSYGGDVETSEDGSSLNYYVRDHLGSVVATASPTQILEKRDHLPYGETWYHTQAGNEFSDQDFNGHYKQGSLLDYNARHYHPTLGKFIQPDSIVPKTDTVGFNRYAYVSNNPVNRIDPSGHNDSYYNKILAAEAAGCVPSCHLDNPYQNTAVGELDQMLSGAVNSYLASEASLGGYDIYMAATGNDPIAGDIGMPAWARGLSLAGALPVVPNLTRIFRGVGELGTDALLASSNEIARMFPRIGKRGTFGEVYALDDEWVIKVASPSARFNYDLDLTNEVMLDEVTALNRALEAGLPALPRYFVGETIDGSVVTMQRRLRNTESIDFFGGKSGRINVEAFRIADRAKAARVGDIHGENLVRTESGEMFLIDANTTEMMRRLFPQP